MECIRCQSKMYHECFLSHQGYFYGWKCLFCGDIVDEVILENRNPYKRNERIRFGKIKKEKKDVANQKNFMPHRF